MNMLFDIFALLLPSSTIYILKIMKHDSLILSNKLLASVTIGRRITKPAWVLLLSVTFVVGLNLAFGLSASIILKSLFSGNSNLLTPYLINSIGMAITFLPIIGAVYLWVIKYEKRPFRSIGLWKVGALNSFMIGGLWAVLMYSTIFIGMIATNSIILGPPTLKVDNPLVVLGLLFILLGRIIQTGAEEVVFRGWVLPVISQQWGIWGGLVASSVIFGLLHVFTNPTLLAAINLTLYGLFLGLYTLRKQNIWGACGWHAFWNWIEPNVFGLSENGSGNGSGLFFATKINSSNNLLNGGFEGTNASILMTGVLFSSILILLLLPNRERHRIPVA